MDFRRQLIILICLSFVSAPVVAQDPTSPTSENLPEILRSPQTPEEIAAAQAEFRANHVLPSELEPGVVGKVGGKLIRAAQWGGNFFSGLAAGTYGFVLAQDFTQAIFAETSRDPMVFWSSWDANYQRGSKADLWAFGFIAELTTIGLTKVGTQPAVANNLGMVTASIGTHFFGKYWYGQATQEMGLNNKEWNYWAHELHDNEMNQAKTMAAIKVVPQDSATFKELQGKLVELHTKHDSIDKKCQEYRDAYNKWRDQRFVEIFSMNENELKALEYNTIHLLFTVALVHAIRLGVVRTGINEAPWEYFVNKKGKKLFVDTLTDEEKDFVKKTTGKIITDLAEEDQMRLLGGLMRNRFYQSLGLFGALYLAFVSGTWFLIASHFTETFFLDLSYMIPWDLGTGWDGKVNVLGWNIVDLRNLRKRVEDSRTHLIEAAQEYVKNNDNQTQHLQQIGQALGEFANTWEGYENTVVLKNFREHTTPYYVKFTNLQRDLYKRKRWVQWIVRGEKLDDLDFVFNGSGDQKFIEAHIKDFTDENSSLKDAIPDLPWHSDYDKARAAFIDEKEGFKKLVKDKKIKTMDDAEAFLRKEERTVQDELRFDSKRFKKSLKPIIKGTYATYGAPVYVPTSGFGLLDYDPSRGLENPFNIRDELELQFRELSRIAKDVIISVPNSDQGQKLLPIAMAFETQRDPFHNEDNQVAFAQLDRATKLPDLNNPLLAQLSAGARAELLARVLTKALSAVYERRGRLKLEVKALVSPLDSTVKQDLEDQRALETMSSGDE